MLRATLLVCSLALLLGGGVLPAAYAQQIPPPPPREITFEEALRIALAQNTRLRQAQNVAEARGDAVELARAAFLPDFTVVAQPIRRYGLAFDQTTGSLQQETSDAVSASVQTSVNLFNGGRDAADLRRRRLEQQAGALSLERTRDDVLFTVASQFLQTILDAEIVRIREEALAAQQAQLDRIEQLVEGGVRPRADVLQQIALTAEAELVVLQAESQLQLAETQLVQTLQLDPFGEYVFVAPSLDDAAAAPEALQLEVLLSAAYERRGDLRAQGLQIRAAEEGVRVARAGYLPRVNLFGAFGSSYSSLAAQAVEGTGGRVPITTTDGEPLLVNGEPFTISIPGQFESIPFGSQFVDNRGGSVGVSLQVPVFDRFTTRAQVRQARLAAENERILLEELEQDVALQVRQAYLDYQNATRRLSVTARQVEAAQAALNAEQERYEFGVATLAELALSRSRLVEAESSRAQAVAQFVFQRRQLEYAAGLITPDLSLFD